MFVYKWNIVHENIGHHNINLSRFYCTWLKSWQVTLLASHFSSSTFGRLESCDKELSSVMLGLFFEIFIEIDGCAVCETDDRFGQPICEIRNSMNSLENFYFIC